MIEIKSKAFKYFYLTEREKKENKIYAIVIYGLFNQTVSKQTPINVFFELRMFPSPVSSV